MKRIYRVYKKTVSIVNETATGMYRNLVGKKKGFLLESYDKNYDRYTFFGVEPEEIISSKGQSLVITKKDGTEDVREGNPLTLLKEYYNEFEIRKDNEELNFSGGLVGSVGYDFVRYSEVLPEENPDEIGIETVQLMLMKEFIVVDHVAETLTAVILESDDETGKETAAKKAAELIKTAMQEQKESEVRLFPDGVITKKSDTLEEYSEKVNKIKQYIRDGHIFQTVLSQRWTIATGQDVQNLINNVKENNPSLVDELVPKLLGLGEIQKVLQNLLREGISIRDLLTILETLADYAPTTRDTDILTEYVRQSLKRAISTKYFPSHETTSVLTLDPKIEQEVMGSVKQTETGAFLNLDPARSKAILNAVGEEIKKLENMGKTPIIMTSPIVRMYFKRLTEDYYPDLVVVSYNEVESNVELQSVGMVTA